MEHELAVLACRPRDLDLSQDLDMYIAYLTSVYTGSVEGSCDICHCVVHIGPNQMVLHQANPSAMIACFRCVAVLGLGGDDPESLDIRSLGNPEQF